jgi:membrane protein implicated in regulation of membrane protease activity
VPAWLAWLIVAVALAVGEIATPGLFVLGPLALAAVASAVAAGLGVTVVWQIAVFVAGALATLLVVRPVARRHLRMPAALRTGTDALVGARALVLQRVDEDGGLVKIGGEEWSARAFMAGQVLEPGARVEVAKIEGATALVYE